MSRFAPALALLAATLAAGASGDAQEIPRPALAEMEPHVRQQLGETRRQLDELLADPAAPAAARAAALGRMGQLYHAYDLSEPAEACYQAAARLAPDDYRWHYYLGLLGQRSGRRAESVAALERALELAPDDPATRLRLADQEREAARLDRAAELYRKLLDEPASAPAGLAGLAQIATARGDHAAAAGYLERALAAQPSATRLRYPLAQAYRRLGELDKAQRELERRGTADVAFPDPLLAELSALASGAAVSLQRGYSAAFAGFDETAIEDYRRAVAADPASPEARRSLAGALADSGDLAGAIAQLRELLRLDPNPAGAHFTLAETLEASGAAEEALAQYRAAVDAAPDFRAFRLGLARALIRAGQLDEAAGHLRRLIALDEHDAAARIDLGEVLLATGQPAAAAVQFDAVLAGDAGERRRAAAHHGLGRALARSATPQAAREQFELALGLAPDYLAAQLGLASLLGSSGRYAEAAAAFRRAVELAPDEESARLGEATALLLAGDQPAAVASLEAGVARLPGSDGLADALARLLAAAPAGELRDGARALALAEPLFARRPTLRHAETLAMALAETGRFADAAALQEQVVADLAGRGEAAPLAAARRALDGYRRGEPHRLR